VHAAPQSCGIGTLLMQVAEDRIRDRARTHTELGVERGEEPEEWDDDQPDGTVARYRTICTLMRKRLS
jgi:hypothetical protein